MSSATLEDLPPPPHEDQYESFEHQTKAAQLGMWVFLASEVLFFTGLFALYTGYRVQHPAAFAEGVRHDIKWDGSLNTLILLLSSYLVAHSIPSTRRGHRKAAIWQLGGVVVLGLAFLGLKGYEYGKHIADGILPGGYGHFFVEHKTPGLPEFFTLYWAMTGLHAIHVTVGLGVVIGLTVHIWRTKPVQHAGHTLEIGAMYWHLVDVIWIFLWPLFYLLERSG